MRYQCFLCKNISIQGFSIKQISFEVAIKVLLKPVNIESLDVADLRMIDSFVRS